MKRYTCALNTDLRTHSGDKTAPEWVELIPAGSPVVGRDGRSWKNDDPYGVVEAFAANGADLPVDIEHATEHKARKGDPAPAVGWIKDVEVREGGSTWGRTEWTTTGRRMIENGEYRYLSPVFNYDRQTNKIARLFSAGLTNQPNLRLKSLNQQNPDTDSGGNHMTVPLAICTALGVSADVTEQQAVATIKQLTDDKEKALNSAQNPSLEKFVPRADHDVALNRAQQAEQKLAAHEQAARNEKIETALNAALNNGTITPATVKYHRTCCQQEGGLELFMEYMKTVPTLCGNTTLDGKEINAAALTNTDNEVARMLGIPTEMVADAKKEAV